MPQIITGSEQDLPPIGTVDMEDQGRPVRKTLSSSPTVLEVMGPLPRMMTPSPVPLHARLSKIQKEAKKGARVIDMESNGSSHHYDYEDVTDSSHDFSSRRHSVAEEDVGVFFSFFFVLCSFFFLSMMARFGSDQDSASPETVHCQVPTCTLFLFVCSEVSEPDTLLLTYYLPIATIAQPN